VFVIDFWKYLDYSSISTHLHYVVGRVFLQKQPCPRTPIEQVGQSQQIPRAGLGKDPSLGMLIPVSKEDSTSAANLIYHWLQVTGMVGPVLEAGRSHATYQCSSPGVMMTRRAAEMEIPRRIGRARA
jgi:hypothetical protein